MITIKRLSECTFNQAVMAWNRGFEGYFSNMTFTLDQFTRRFVLDGLSPNLSIVAFDGEEPVGFILSGIRVINGKRVSWNGGTGVATDYRGKGVGQQLMEAAISIYKDEEVEIALLEAISQNERAIKLYTNYGYKVIDQLVHLHQNGPLPTNVLAGSSDYTIERKLPVDVIELPFYKSMASWQTHWNNGRDGESIIVSDADGNKVGYALYRRAFNEEAKQIAIVLIQCEIAPGREDEKEIVHTMLHELYVPSMDIQRSVINMPVGNASVITSLQECGFSVKVEQVHMLKEM
jgi:ribosomal protein S18 acetylase RimI-like enzyme